MSKHYHRLGLDSVLWCKISIGDIFFIFDDDELVRFIKIGICTAILIGCGDSATYLEPGEYEFNYSDRVFIKQKLKLSENGNM